ncbi:MAG TPA: bifunctional nuclease family protein [Ilumatobacteraceae bacterium]
MDIAMELVGVRVEVPDNTPVLVLREQEGRQRVLPIMIGTPEASAIHYALEGVTSPRPMTHDLFVDVLAVTGVQLLSVVVTEIREHTYYAELRLLSASGPLVVSSRPSDALALAARTGAQIFATDELLDAVGQEASALAEMDSAEEDESILDEFRDFIDSIKPEDFSG